MGEEREEKRKIDLIYEVFARIQAKQRAKGGGSQIYVNLIRYVARK